MGNHPGGGPGPLALASAHPGLPPPLITGIGHRTEPHSKGVVSSLASFIASQSHPSFGRGTVSWVATEKHPDFLLLAHLDRRQFLLYLKSFDLQSRVQGLLAEKKQRKENRVLEEGRRELESTRIRGPGQNKKPRAHVIVCTDSGNLGSWCPTCDRRKMEVNIYKQDEKLFQKEFERLEELLKTAVASSSHLRTIYKNFESFTRNAADPAASPYPRRRACEKDLFCPTCEQLEAACMKLHSAASLACYKVEGLCIFVDVHRDKIIESLRRAAANKRQSSRKSSDLGSCRTSRTGSVSTDASVTKNFSLSGTSVPFVWNGCSSLSSLASLSSSSRKEAVSGCTTTGQCTPAGSSSIASAPPPLSSSLAITGVPVSSPFTPSLGSPSARVVSPPTHHSADVASPSPRKNPRVYRAATSQLICSTSCLPSCAAARVTPLASPIARRLPPFVSRSKGLPLSSPSLYTLFSASAKPQPPLPVSCSPASSPPPAAPLPSWPASSPSSDRRLHSPLRPPPSGRTNPSHAASTAVFSRFKCARPSDLSRSANSTRNANVPGNTHQQTLRTDTAQRCLAMPRRRSLSHSGANKDSRV